MTTRNSAFKLSALAAALLAIYGTARADEAEIRELSQPDSSISVGVGNWTNERVQQGMYDGMSERGVYGNVDVDIRKRDEASGTWVTVQGQNLGLETRRIEGEVLQQGNIGASVSYNRIVRENPLRINTSLQGIGHETQRIGGGFYAAQPSREVELGTRRDILQAGFYKHLMPELDLKLSFKNEEKNGGRNWGLGSNPYFLVEPIDSVTQQFDAILEYTGERLQVSGGYAGSWYGNQNSMVRATYRGATDTADTLTPLSLPLDNEAHQFFLNAGYSLSSSTRMTLKMSRSVATQDETLPSFGLPSPFSPFSGAPSSLDGKIVTSLVELGLSSRVTSDFTLSGNLRYHDVDDQTPLSGFVGTGSVATVHNTPHSYETKSGKFEAVYRLPQQFRLIAGVDFKDQDRSAPTNVEETERYVPYKERLDETTYRLQLRRSMSDTLNGAVAFLFSERDGSHRVLPHEPELLPDGVKIFDMINPLHIADRTRQKIKLSADWSPAQAFGVQFNVEGGHDNYAREDGRPYGLRDGDTFLVSLDARYALSSAWQLNGWVSHDTTRAKQAGWRWSRELTSGRGSPQPPILEAYKDATLEDRGDSIGLGLRGAFGERIKVGADVQWTRTRSLYDEDVQLTGNTGTGVTTTLYPSNGAVPLPDIENKLIRVSLFAKYALNKQADVRFDAVHEQWKTDDWTWSFANGAAYTYGSTTSTVDRTTVALKPRETTNFYGVRYIYKFQ